MKKNSIRIISGKWRGRKIPVYKTKKLRPTLNRIKETLFNWLSNFVYNANCLDCFSGTGSLAIEALSRNAKSATLLEIRKKILSKTSFFLSKLNVKNATLIQADTINYLKNKGKPYDIIFLDPPFYTNLVKKTILLLEKNNWLKNCSLIYIQTEKNNISKYIPKNWHLYRKKKLKKFSFYLYIRKKP